MLYVCSWKRSLTQYNNSDKYQLSLTDPCDKIVLLTELDDLCNEQQ